MSRIEVDSGNGRNVAGRAGLREQKKRETRERIASVARELFTSHGYERVTVAQVAAEAGVSEATVFNYFPTKDELFFGGGLEQFQTAMLAAVRDRPSTESAVAAYRRFTIGNIRHAADPNATELILAGARILTSSPSLQARERELIAAATDALADALTKHSNRFEAWVVANALMGIQRAIVAEVRSEVLAGRRGSALTSRVRRHANRAFDRLEAGLS